MAIQFVHVVVFRPKFSETVEVLDVYDNAVAANSAADQCNRERANNEGFYMVVLRPFRTKE